MPEELVARIAELLRERNALDEEIAAITCRPMSAGHLGEWLASRIFGIELEHSAVAAGIDGTFCSGPLRGKTVNVSGISSARDCWIPVSPPARLLPRPGRAAVGGVLAGEHPALAHRRGAPV